MNLRKLALWIMQTKPYRWLLKRVIPYIRFTTYYPKLVGIDYHAGHKLLEKGDIILCVDKMKLTTKLIGGTFSHAALCTFNNLKNEIYLPWYETLEMTHDDCVRRTFFDTCKESDRVVIIRCWEWDHEYVQSIVNKAQGFYDSGIKYDGEFKLGVEFLYCSELIYESDFERRLKVSLDDLAGLGREYISPDGLFHAENVEVVWDSES